MKYKAHPAPKTCWIGSIATITDIDVELFPADLDSVPMFNLASYRMRNTAPFEGLLDSLGYRMKYLKKPPKNKPHIRLMAKWEGPNNIFGHAAVVDENGIIHDHPFTGLDGLHISQLENNPLIFLRQAVVLEEKT